MFGETLEIMPDGKKMVERKLKENTVKKRSLWRRGNRHEKVDGRSREGTV
jgi:hypothetical protein